MGKRIMTDVLIVSPAPSGDVLGNAVTADRWAQILEGLGLHVRVVTEFDGEPAKAETVEFKATEPLEEPEPDQKKPDPKKKVGRKPVTTITFTLKTSDEEILAKLTELMGRMG